MAQRKYIITASCDPYNARFHYNDQRVLAHNGPTPIKWVDDDNYGDGYSFEEAMDILDRYANNLNDNTSFIDDDYIAQLRNEVSEDYGEELDASWYKGEGWYEDQTLIYKRGDESLRDDTMTYCIEDIEDHPLPCVSKREASIRVAQTYIDYASEYKTYDDIGGLVEALNIINEVELENVYVADIERRLNPYLDQLKEFIDEQL